jgi:hypothetical protein
MQRSYSFRFSAASLMAATSLLVLFSPAVWAQNTPPNPDKVLVPGNPPLTESIVTSTIDFRSWVLEIPFTAQQKMQQRAMMVQNWQNPRVKSNPIWTALEIESMGGLRPEDSEFDQVNFQEKAVKSLRADTGNPESQWLIKAYDAAHPPIAAGDPPLTESMVSHYTTFLAWLLEVPLTQDFKNYMRAMLIRDWKDPKDQAGDMVILKQELEMSRVPHGSTEREFLRSFDQPDMIMRNRPNKKDPDPQYLVAAYDAAHRPIATGVVPLTRQASDAWTELYCFVSTQKGTPMVASPAAKDDFAKVLTQKFATFPPEQQKALAKMPQTWTTMRMAWLVDTKDIQEKLIAMWQRILPANQPNDPQLAAAEAALDRVNAFKAKDPNSVTQQELLSAANDSDLVAQQYRRSGGKQNLVNAGGFEELAAALHTGSKQAYVNLMAQWKANGEMLAIMRAQYAARSARTAARAISNMYVINDAGMANVISNINNSPNQTIVVPVTPK